MLSRSLLLFCTTLALPVFAADRPVSAFYGEYIGTVSNGGSRDRDLNVAIRPGPEGKGFQVKWVTVTHKTDGRIKRKTYQIPFMPTERANIFSSAMRTNVFGGKTSLDPLRGDPLFWARIEGDTLTVNAFRIDDDGNYNIQSYRRTLTEKGLLLEFTRSHAGEPQVTLEAELIRVAD